VLVGQQWADMRDEPIPGGNVSEQRVVEEEPAAGVDPAIHVGADLDQRAQLLRMVVEPPMAWIPQHQRANQGPEHSEVDIGVGERRAPVQKALQRLGPAICSLEVAKLDAVGLGDAGRRNRLAEDVCVEPETIERALQVPACL
jgi:hypothetical protein